MVKVFNKVARTFLLFDEKKENSMKIPPLASVNVPDDYVGDITFRTAVACGELVIWQEAKEVDAMQRAAEEKAEKKPAEEKAGKKGAANKPEKAKGE